MTTSNTIVPQGNNHNGPGDILSRERCSVPCTNDVFNAIGTPTRTYSQSEAPCSRDLRTTDLRRLGLDDNQLRQRSASRTCRDSVDLSGNGNTRKPMAISNLTTPTQAEDGPRMDCRKSALITHHIQASAVNRIRDEAHPVPPISVICTNQIDNSGNVESTTNMRDNNSEHPFRALQN